MMMIRHGTILPLHFPAHAWFYLGLSGVVGFLWGYFLIQSPCRDRSPCSHADLQFISPTAALLEWIFLGQSYTISQWSGMFITLSGVSIVIFERNQSKTKPSALSLRKISVKGILLAFGAMTGQAVGYILSKTGMQTDNGYLDAFAATQIRAFTAFVCFLIFSL